MTRNSCRSTSRKSMKNKMHFLSTNKKKSPEKNIIKHFAYRKYRARVREMLKLELLQKFSCYKLLSNQKNTKWFIIKMMMHCWWGQKHFVPVSDKMLQLNYVVAEYHDSMSSKCKKREKQESESRWLEVFPTLRLPLFHSAPRPCERTSEISLFNFYFRFFSLYVFFFRHLKRSEHKTVGKSLYLSSRVRW